jgi:predicted nuclease of predicted toxin-antitoxin system
MKFLLDAQLPGRLARSLQQAGHDATHTLDLPLGNRTPDSDIVEICEREDRIVVTKDADFVNSFYLSAKPAKLLLVSTGNITNASLEALFQANIAAIDEAFQMHSFIELTRTSIITHV